MMTAKLPELFAQAERLIEDIEYEMRDRLPAYSWALNHGRLRGMLLMLLEELRAEVEPKSPKGRPVEFDM